MSNSFQSRVFPPVRDCVRIVLMLVPTLLLIGASLRAPQPNHWMLWIGTGFQAIVCLLSLFSPRSWQHSYTPSIITLYIIALCWLWLGAPVKDWYLAMSQAILLLVPLSAFAYQTLSDSGAPEIRRARVLTDRLAGRKEWPTTLTAIRSLSEVKALRAALHFDASPALALLGHEKIPVRIAALAALEFRKEWKPGQAELVLQTALRAEQPTLRAAAVFALGNVEDRDLVERVATFLHDPAREVRQAAIESLLWDTETRWNWIRFAVRRGLADPLFQHDGPLWHESLQLTREAINDLTAWTTEKGILPSRAALTLGAHYDRLVADGAESQLLQSLREMVGSSATPAVLRIEVGKVLQHHQELDGEVLYAMLGAANPAPLRMIAIETILNDESGGTLFESAIAALKDVARLPNREIALSTAELIQRRLGVDLGLGIDKALPELHSRQAAEITRRVMLWAAENDGDDPEESGVLASQRA